MHANLEIIPAIRGDIGNLFLPAEVWIESENERIKGFPQNMGDNPIYESIKEPDNYAEENISDSDDLVEYNSDRKYIPPNCSISEQTIHKSKKDGQQNIYFTNTTASSNKLINNNIPIKESLQVINNEKGTHKLPIKSISFIFNYVPKKIALTTSESIDTNIIPNKLNQVFNDNSKEIIKNKLSVNYANDTILDNDIVNYYKDSILDIPNKVDINNNFECKKDENILKENILGEKISQIEIKSPKMVIVGFDNDNINNKSMSLSEIFRTNRKSLLQRLKHQEKPLRRSAEPKLRCKENLLLMRREMMKRKSNKISHKPSSELLDRLTKGTKVKISKDEMYKLTNKNYELLPEVKRKKELLRKKEEVRNRFERLKQLKKVYIYIIT